MDFGSLTRRELQSLCKLNKIPANITNVAMANALKSLEIVEGIEEFLKTSKSETSDTIESTEKVEAPSPKVPQTSCRTATRQKLTKIEAENLPPTVTRTTRRGTRQLAGAADESKTDLLKTPAVTGSRRKALATSSCRNVNNQLNECQEEVVTQSRRKEATVKKEERTVQKAYSTRRSTRLTEKKSTEPRVRKESYEAVKIDSFLDEVNVASKEERGEPVEILENTVESENPSAEVEDICKAFEKLDVLVVEESCDNMMLDKTLNVDEVTLKSGNEKEEDDDAINNPKPESHEISNPCEDVYVEEKVHVEEAPLEGEIKILNTESDEIKNPNTESEEVFNPCEDVYVGEKLNVEAAPLKGEIKILNTESDEIKNPNSGSEETLNPCEDAYVEEKLNVEEIPIGEIKILNTESEEIKNPNSESEETLNPCEDAYVEEKQNVEEIPIGEIKILTTESDEALNPCEDDSSEAENVDYPNSESEETLNPCEDAYVEGKLNVEEIPIGEIKILNTESEEALNPCEDDSSEAENEVDYLKPESDSLSNPFENHDSEEKKFDFSEEVISEEHSDSMVHEETKNEIPESDGSPSIVCNSNNFSAVEEVSENMVDANEENGQVEASSFAATCIPTPTKKSLMIVSDNKENNMKIVKIMDKEEKKKEVVENMSIRQLRKQLKTLTLKKINAVNQDNDRINKEVKTRMPLQALCDNQLAAAGQVLNNNNDDNN